MKTMKLFLFITGISLLDSCHNQSDSITSPPYGDPPVYPVIDAYPAWSPDGKTIIYNHGGIIRIDVGGSYYSDPDSAGLWIINADGTNPHLILKGSEECVDWNPDGKWIAFEDGGQIYKVPIIGHSIVINQIQQLTITGSNFFPSWSSDGEWIAYDSNVDNPTRGYSIWTMYSDGNNKRILVSGRMANWAPIGIYIIFIDFHNEIYRVDVNDTSKVDRLTSLNQSNIYATDNRYPKYSPNGTKIVFESDANIWTMNADGTNQIPLTTDGGYQPSWSPDGQKIVYIGFTGKKYDPQNNGTLWVMNNDGSNKRQVTFGPK